jgi:hypothetical protein
MVDQKVDHLRCPLCVTKILPPPFLDSSPSCLAFLSTQTVSPANAGIKLSSIVRQRNVPLPQSHFVQYGSEVRDTGSPGILCLGKAISVLRHAQSTRFRHIGGFASSVGIKHKGLHPRWPTSTESRLPCSLTAEIRGAMASPTQFACMYSQILPQPLKRRRQGEIFWQEWERLTATQTAR